MAAGRSHSGPPPLSAFAGWVRVERPASRWTAAAAHGPAALVSGLVILVAYLFDPYRFPFSVCSFLNLTGYPCPFCGSTRAFHLMAHARWAEAVRENPFAAALFVAAAGIFAINTAAATCGRRVRIGPRLKPGRRGAWWIAASGAALLTASWLYRLAAGLR